MKKLIIGIFFGSFILAECPDGFYEDDCGNCWMAYCYDFVSHAIQYDLNEDECLGQTQIWVLPGDPGDPYFNNYCDSCPDGFYEDDCGGCWMGYCYTLFQDPPHTVYYDLSEEECNDSGYNYYLPGADGDPYYNSNCPDEEYDYLIHAGNYYYEPSTLEISVGSTIMWFNDGGYHNVNGEVNTITGELYNNPESFYLDANSGGELGTFTFNIPGTYNYDCSIGSHADMGMIGTIIVIGDEENDCSDCMDYCVSYVMENYGYSEEAATDWCSTTPDSQYGCADSCYEGPDYCQTGDSNLDGDLNVLDIVLTVEMVLGATIGTDEQQCAADTNGDGVLNVLDVVQTVEMILGTRGVEADRAEILMNGSDVFYASNGTVGAFQMTLSHNNAFELSLTDDALVSDYRTIDNVTTLIIVAPESNHLFTAKGHYVIEEVLAATTNGYINIDMDIPLTYSISSAYPNPFNPSTTISLDINTDAQVSISVYNTMGQLMDVLVNDKLSAGSYPFVWNAQDAPSGMYFIKSEINSAMSTQKILLLK